jgi:hypothetical protein
MVIKVLSQQPDDQYPNNNIKSKYRIFRYVTRT